MGFGIILLATVINGIPQIMSVLPLLSAVPLISLAKDKNNHGTLQKIGIASVISTILISSITVCLLL